jgi:hypothetical protein
MKYNSINLKSVKLVHKNSIKIQIFKFWKAYNSSIQKQDLFFSHCNEFIVELYLIFGA